MRAPADPHVPGPRVRAEGVGQDRAQGHAPHGAQVPDTGGESLEEVQLVQGRGRRTGAEPAQARLPGRQAVREAQHRRHRVQGRRRQGLSRAGL